MNDLSSGIRMWAQLSSVLSQITHLTDGQMDGWTDRQTDKELSPGLTDFCMQRNNKSLKSNKTNHETNKHERQDKREYVHRGTCEAAVRR